MEADAIPPNAIRDRPIPLRGIARRGQGANLDFILSITPEFVEELENALDTAYPFKKLDLVAAPDWPSGATELAGAITYRESRILVEGTPTPARKRSITGVHSHELAHMWFGDFVTPPWWMTFGSKSRFPPGPSRSS